MSKRTLVANADGSKPAAMFTLRQDDADVNIVLNGKTIAFFEPLSDGRIKFYSMNVDSSEFVTDGDDRIQIHG